MATHLGRSGVFFGLVFIALGFAYTVYGQGANLIPNGTFETASGSVPTGWKKSYWGSPAPTFTYPAQGNNSSRGASITLSANSTGDGNWQLSSPIAVTPGASYTYSTWYKSNVASEIDAAYTTSNGKVTYTWLADIPSSANIWKQYTISFVIPAGVSKATIFQLISKKGTLTVDDVSLVPTGTNPTPPPAPPPPPPPPSTPTLLFTASSTLLTVGQSTTLSWSSTNATGCSASGGWSGTKSVNGTQSVSPSATTTYTLSCSGLGGSILKSVTVGVKAPTPTPPPPSPPPSSTQFSEGMVSFTFDDSWLSHYSNALPILQLAGIKGTFYLTTQPIQEGWIDFMTPSQVQTIASQGHEIADHTVTHPHLPQISSSQITNEIVNSRTYLQNLAGKSVTTIAYPYGEFNSTVVSLVKQAGYTSARGVEDETLSTPITDKYNLTGDCVLKSTNLATIKAKIDAAKNNKQWYILCFHEIRDLNDDYSIPAAEFQQIVDYIKQAGIKTVTVSEGLSLMAN